MANLKKQFVSEIVPQLKNELKISNTIAVPTMQKVTLNIVLGKVLKDKAHLETVESTMECITG